MLVIASGQRHAILQGGAETHILFVDPHAIRTGSVSTSLRAPATIAFPVPPSTWVEVDQRVEQILRAFVVPSHDQADLGPVSNRAVDEVRSRIPDLLGQGKIRLLDLAALVDLSPSRLSHLFRKHTGTTLQSYIRWQRLVAATAHLADGASITHASSLAGFADGSHYTKTFRAMFGLSPTEAISSASFLRE